MAIPILCFSRECKALVPYGMGYFAYAKSASHYTEWSKRVHRPTNLEWIRRNSIKRKRMRKIKRIYG
jgi:hypothetical protein